MNEKPRTFFDRLMAVLMFFISWIILYFFIDAFFTAWIEGP